MNGNIPPSTIKDDTETAKWLAEIESFRSPPPPRKLFGSSLVPYSPDSGNNAQEKCRSRKPDFSTAKRLLESDCERRLQKLNLNPENIPNNVIDKQDIEKLNSEVRRACRPVAVEPEFVARPEVYDNLDATNPNLNKEPKMPKPKFSPQQHLNGERQFNNATVYDIPVIQKIKNRKDLKKPEALVGPKAFESQQLKFLQFEAEIEQSMDRNGNKFGQCCKCNEWIEEPNAATQAMGRIYHSKCFTCQSCGRTLTGRQFYEANGKIYCEEDYFYCGYQDAADRCAVCGHFIMDMILQAVGKSFHPSCFRCSHCKERLDGVPFTMDDEGRVYCVGDYHKLFAPTCAKCRKAITPTSGREETVRVVAMRKDFHVDCYVCEGCALQLTDDSDRQCYPLGDHLLCYQCHVQWTGRDDGFLISDV